MFRKIKLCPVDFKRGRNKMRGKWEKLKEIYKIPRKGKDQK